MLSFNTVSAYINYLVHLWFFGVFLLLFFFFFLLFFYWSCRCSEKNSTCWLRNHNLKKKQKKKCSPNAGFQPRPPRRERRMLTSRLCGKPVIRGLEQIIKQKHSFVRYMYLIMLCARIFWNIIPSLNTII